jgi:hypothetical protein
MDLLQSIQSVLIWVILPWAVWVTNSIFKVKQDQAINTVIHHSLKENFDEIKTKLDRLLEIQSLRNLGIDRKGKDH